MQNADCWVLWWHFVLWLLPTWLNAEWFECMNTLHLLYVMYSGHNFARDLGSIFRLFRLIPPPYIFIKTKNNWLFFLQKPSKFGQAIIIWPLLGKFWDGGKYKSQTKRSIYVFPLHLKIRILCKWILGFIFREILFDTSFLKCNIFHLKKKYALSAKLRSKCKSPGFMLEI